MSEQPRQSPEWAAVRFALGIIQIAGATCGFVLLLTVGAKTPTFVAVAVTGCVSIISRILFRRKKIDRVGKT